MKSYNDTLSEYLVLTHDSSSDNSTLGGILINQCIHKVLAMADFTFMRNHCQILTVANQQDYDTPGDLFRIRNVSVYSGGIWYCPKECVSSTPWQLLNRVINTSDVPIYWYFHNTSRQFSLYPIPASDGNIIKISYQRKIADLGAEDYTEGTISTTAGSSVITGSGTDWTSDMAGRYIQVKGLWHRIKTIDSPTSLTTYEYVNTTNDDIAYKIAEVIPFPDGFEDIPLYYSVWQYYLQRETNVNIATMYEEYYKEAVAELIRRDNKVTDNLLKKDTILQDIYDLNPNDYPLNLH